MTAGDRSARAGRLVRAADFERVLRMHARFLSTHFAVHHANGVPASGAPARRSALTQDLSTGRAGVLPEPVDDLPAEATAQGTRATGPRIYFGAVVPKRHARRAVTRTLLKRQIRAVALAHVDAMPDGLWVVRLRSTFDRSAFTSAASPVLRRAVREELDRLLSRCDERPPGRV